MYYVYTLQGPGYKTNSVRQAVEYLRSVGVTRSLANVKKWIAKDGDWFSAAQAAGITRYDAHELRDIPLAPTVDDQLWTDEENQVLFDHYEKHGPAFCREVLIALGLRIRNNRVIGHHGRIVLGLSYKGPHKSQYKPGNIPASKGKRMSAEQYKICAPNMFKGGIRGAAAHNYVPIGHETLRHDCYIYVKIAEGKWKEKHRWLWEQHHGPIPPGGLVVFRDRNRLNCTIENLELITRAEHARRNRKHGPTEFGLHTGSAARGLLKKRGIPAKVIHANPGLVQLVQAEILLKISKRNKHGRS